MYASRFTPGTDYRKSFCLAVYMKKLSRVFPGEVYAYEKHVQTGRSIFKNLDEELEPIKEYHDTVKEINRGKKMNEDEKLDAVNCVRNLYATNVSEKYDDVEENVFVTR